MKLIDSIVDTFWRIRKRISEVDYKTTAKNVVNWVGNVMHKLVFEFLLPKKYRGITKKQIFEIIFKSDTPAGKKFDVWLLVLIVANILLLIFDSAGSTDTMTRGGMAHWSFWLMKVLEWGFTILFTLEYYLRIYCLKQPMKYVLSFWGVIDFLSIFPAYLSLFIPATQALTVLRLLRVMRIFRIFKLHRFQVEAKHLLNALRASAVKILVFMLFVLVAAVILGTLMYSFEANHNPQFGNILSGIYWAVVTITTVGYGDMAPVTHVGRFLAVAVMLLGYSIIAVPTGIVAGEVVNEYRNPAPKKKHRSAIERQYDEEDEAIKN